MKKYHTLYLMVRAVVETELTTISDAVHEVETHSAFILPDTPRVKILETEILLTRITNPNKINHGTQS
jgi:hypothetical protein